MTRTILSVSQLTNYLKGLMESDWTLQNLWLKGEISNFKHHSSGHMYFSLKDQDATIKAVFFKTRAMRLLFQPQNGQSVIVRGYISLFPRDGQYQVYVEEMQPDGLGSLYLAYEQLKQQLQEEGLFDQSRKKTLPLFPKCIALVTSPKGAALKDMLTVLNRRYPKLHVIIVPVQVQGESAPREIKEAIERVNKVAGVDLIITGRGGGSIEELWAFNTELVARAIANSQIPVISAVGHETDTTIADYVADFRAATPSMAAEIAVPEISQVTRRINDLEYRLRRGLKESLETGRNRLAIVLGSRVMKRPQEIFRDQAQRLDYLSRDLKSSVEKNIKEKNHSFSRLIGALDNLSPLNTLSRGYSLTRTHEEDYLIKSIKELKTGQTIITTLTDGEVISVVEKIKEGLDDGTKS